MTNFSYQTVDEEIYLQNERYIIRRFADFEATVDCKIAALAAEGIKELAAEDCPYFGELWHSAKCLAEILQREDLEQKSILELGCGLALPSLVAAKRGALCTSIDLHPDVALFLSHNLDLNNLDARSIVFKCVRWSGFRASSKFDRIIASDVMYEAYHVDELVNCLKANLEPISGKATIVDPCRWYHLHLIESLRSSGFAVTSTYESLNDSHGTTRLCIISATLQQ